MACSIRDYRSLTKYNMVFSSTWFENHQRKLIFLLNNKFTRTWFRWCLRINCSERINRITPNSYTYGAKKKGKKVEMTTDFRIEERYGLNLYNSFKYLWWTIHFIDWLILDRFALPNFWFATLTVYPDAGSGGTTCDGTANRSGVDSTIAVIRAGAGTGSGTASGSASCQLSSSTTNPNYALMQRSFATFDTSPLTSGATISAAVLSLYATSKTNGLSGEASANSAIVLVASTQASDNALVDADFSQVGTTDFGRSASQDSITTSAYNDITINASGITAISKTGITKYALRSGWDFDNTVTGITWASGADQRWLFQTTDAAANSPRLVVTYTLPSTSWFFLMF